MKNWKHLLELTISTCKCLKPFDIHFTLTEDKEMQQISTFKTRNSHILCLEILLKLLVEYENSAVVDYFLSIDRWTNCCNSEIPTISKKLYRLSHFDASRLHADRRHQ